MTSFEKVDFLQRYIDFFNISPSLFCMKIVCVSILNMSYMKSYIK